jgi:peptidoglycan/LPS O-acetylase OafA/YrhL
MTFIKAFDPARNMATLLEQAPGRTLGGLDGLRTLSMFWIILAHTGLLTLLLGQEDPNTYLILKEKLEFQFVVATDKAVDTFFLISGILMSYTTINKLRKGKTGAGAVAVKAPLFTFLRFLRLTPMYGFVIFFYATVVPHMGTGPLWQKMVDETGLCRKQWWTNLLFVNNFHPTEFHETCMSWTWYLANDMQFFIVGLLMLFVYVNSRKAAYGIMIVVCILSNVLGYVKLVHTPDQSAVQDAWYDKPYMRISPTFIGMMIGMALRDTNLKDKRLGFVTRTALMAMAIASILFTLYIQYQWDKLHAKEQTSQFRAHQSSAYATFARIFFVFGVSVIILLGVTKNGGVVYRFLGSGFWEPLGKLTFGAYLVHPIILRGVYYSSDQLFHWTIWHYSIVYMGTVLISYLAAIVLHILVELPFANLVALAMGPLLAGKPKKTRPN